MIIEDKIPIPEEPKEEVEIFPELRILGTV